MWFEILVYAIIAIIIAIVGYAIYRIAVGKDNEPAKIPEFWLAQIECGKKFPDYAQLLFDKKSGYIFEMRSPHFFTVAIYKDRFRAVKEGSPEAKFFAESNSKKPVYYGANAWDYAPARKYEHDADALIAIFGKENVVVGTYKFSIIYSYNDEMAAQYTRLTTDPFYNLSNDL